MNRRDFLLCLGGLATLAATPAYGQVWRRICVSTTTGGSACSGGAVTDWKQICTSDGNCAGRGYFGAGWNGLLFNEIDGIDFTTEAAINPAATLVAARYSPAGVNSSSRGYFGGGTVAVASTEIDGIDFTTEAAINPAAALSVAQSNAAGVNSTTHGYFGGGTNTTGLLSIIRGIAFTTETSTNPAATLVLARKNGYPDLAVFEDSQPSGFQ